MATQIEINPNLRLDDDYTMVDLDRDVHGDVVVLQRVHVYEPVSGIVGTGWVAEIDDADRTVKVLVEWSSLMIPRTITHSSQVVARNQSINVPSTMQNVAV